MPYSVIPLAPQNTAWFMQLIMLLIMAMSNPAFSAAPRWVNQAPELPDVIYGVGSAVIINDKASAMNSATERAKLELLLSLKTTAEGSVDTFSSYQVVQDSFSSDRSLQQTTRLSTRADNIPGIRIAESYFDDQDNTVYALAELDVQLARTDIVKQQMQVEQNILHLAELSDQAIGTLATLQQTRQQLSQLLSLSDTLSSQLSTLILQRNQELQQQFNQQASRIRQAMSFGWHTKSNQTSARQRNAVQAIFSSLGLTWTAQQAFYRVRLIATEEPVFNAQYQTTTIHSHIDFAIIDRNGDIVFSDQLSAKGVSAGNYVAPAQRQLDQDIQQQLKMLIDRWLNGLQ